MIQVQHLRKTYGSLRAVGDISFEVPNGQLFGFLGPNGAGKTTTLSMISGLLRPDEGRVLIDDIDVWEQPRLAKRILGLVPQDIALYEELSAVQNLKFWGSLYNLSKAELENNIKVWLEKVGLADRAKEAVKNYSGGMKRRLNLAIGLIHNPRMVLLDEPTVGIDPQARNNIMDVIRDIARTGVTILFTTHHLEEAEDLCERIAIMDHGKILAVGSVQELAKVVGDKDIIEVSGKFSALQFQGAFQNNHLNYLHSEDNRVAFALTPEIALASVMQRMGEANLEISDISIQKPTLEKVFLKLTGRELRD